MEKIKYGITLSGKRGSNTIMFNSLSERMIFLTMINSGEYTGSITLLEKTEVKQEEIK